VNDEAVKWLREQIEARLEIARNATLGPWFVDEMSVRGAPDGNIAAPSIRNTLVGKHTWPQEAAHIIANDPQDVMARCEAELAILDAHGHAEHYCPLPVLPSTHGQLWTSAEGPCWTVRQIASGYRHREGYAQHWEA